MAGESSAGRGAIGGRGPTAAPGARFLLLGAACLVAHTEHPGDSHSVDARELLERMSHVYGVCRSYQDVGRTETPTESKGRWSATPQTFRTVFVRPDRFRFEFWERGKRYVVWRHGADVRTWWDLEPIVERPASLHEALGPAIGVTARTANTIAVLLMRDELSGWSRLNELENPSRLPDERLGQTECFRVQGRLDGSMRTLWLDKGTLLIRRVEEQLPFAFAPKATTTYDAAVDRDIAESALAFGAGGQQ